mmetsp:Transcript_40638/g.130814  ORF Transcript_40638/g.130814 Transcript_40638/m.130814 type:complete len:209 (-) Transcript_40638:194-820(-)
MYDTIAGRADPIEGVGEPLHADGLQGPRDAAEAAQGHELPGLHEGREVGLVQAEALPAAPRRLGREPLLDLVAVLQEIQLARRRRLPGRLQQQRLRAGARCHRRIHCLHRHRHHGRSGSLCGASHSNHLRRHATRSSSRNRSPSQIFDRGARLPMVLQRRRRSAMHDLRRWRHLRGCAAKVSGAKVSGAKRTDDWHQGTGTDAMPRRH